MSSPDELHLNRLHQIAQNSADLDRSIEFYRDKLGAKYIAKFDPPGLAFFDLEGTRLLLEKGATGATLYFWVDDIRSACETLRSRGISFDSEPHLIHHDETGTFGPAGTEEWMAFFRDPDDNILALASRTSP
jgi:methylmalonyl-CoA/ethylmalonyl-CoA epimerase